MARFSNFGSGVEVAAPGGVQPHDPEGGIWSTTIGGKGVADIGIVPDAPGCRRPRHSARRRPRSCPLADMRTAR
ncbi:protein of unknown function [Blastococcus saxobsidens DD2]|uniref:Uncharacterized protein n=1 Tax=Blastococcus saxobsidens (strain DD2) TaxID=1146883 RepID=H6RVY9_BLASD|nr:protein of unknown function [Blastococcus saxobsidens DD2]